MGKRTAPVENGDYAAFCGRMVKALGRRVGAGDVEDLRLIRDLQVALKVAEGQAVAGLLAQGYSYGQIGAGLGVSRQAVHKAWVSHLHRFPNR